MGFVQHALAAVVSVLLGAFGIAPDTSLTMTNVSGIGGECSVPTADAVCAPLFEGQDPLYPGGPPTVANVTITIHGDVTTSEAGLYVRNFVSPASSSDRRYCTAADPASKLNVTIQQGGATIYSGGLAELAQSHGDAQHLIHLRGGHNGSGAVDRWAPGDSSTFSIAVALDRSADNQYMGCTAQADLVWLASQ